MIQTIVTAAILYIATKIVDLLVILLIFLLEQRLRKNIEIFILVLLQT
jgi:cadmium resistance protein CadD (predicted permease)